MNTMTHPIYPCLWFDGNAKDAADFYCSVFKDSSSRFQILLFPDPALKGITHELLPEY